MDDALTEDYQVPHFTVIAQLFTTKEDSSSCGTMLHGEIIQDGCQLLWSIADDLLKLFSHSYESQS
jgi:hypothetical protein